jgi:hypothetical protein
LVHSRGVEGRVAVPVDKLEGMFRVHRLGLTVAHEQDLGRARRRRVAVLAVRVGLTLGLGHEAQEYGARATAAASPTDAAKPELATATERQMAK